MSTTVTYKGSTLTTAENQTRTLKTSGKYLEDDITIVDVTSGSVIGGITQDANGYLVIDPNGSGVPITVESLSVTNNGTYTAPTGKAYSPVSVSVSGQVPVLQAKSKTYTPTESQQTETITADTGYDGLNQVDVTVNAISSSYVGSAIDRRDSTNLSANGATVTAPAGYYASSASKSVASGTAGTPTATKGTVSNHAITVTPSVTNTTGYITGGTKTGTGVSVSASELVSGTLNITSSGTKDVTNYANASVSAGTEGTPTATKGTVSNHSISVTPSVTNTAGYISGSTKTGTAVTVSASELVSGSETKTANGTYDVTNLAELVVNVSGGGSVTVDPLSVTQNGTYTAQTGHAYSPVTVNVTGGSLPRKQINFIDYDGTVVESYTKTEWQSVSALPSNPTHTGLTAQGWNWTKAQIDAQLTAMPNDDIWVGQMYVTTSGDTEIDVHFSDASRLEPTLSICVNGTVTVDWGDNTTPDTVTAASLNSSIAVPHSYSAIGSYMITIHVVSGTFRFYWGNSYTLLRKNTNINENIVYASCISAVRFGSGVTNIGSFALYYCISLQYVTIPSTITSVGGNIFRNCYLIKSITIPSGVTSIETYAFGACYNLQSVSIPSTVTSIGNNAVEGCHILQSITIPSGVTSIGNNAFSNCYHFQSVTIPSNVTSIGASTFSSCKTLRSITIPSGVTSIGNYAFNECDSLQSIIIPSTVTSYGNGVFQNNEALQSVAIPENTTSIAEYMFTSCLGLRSFTIPSTVTNIKKSAFSSCYNLQSITIPSDVTSIGESAFYNCQSLKSITIPSKVSSIGKNALGNCNGVAEYHIKPTTPPSLGATVFYNIPSDCKIYVPSASLATYQADSAWSAYSSYMVGE